jgi:hypothetical protein
MVKQSPVIHPAPSERRKTAASAISGGVPNRLRGIRSRIFSSNEGSGHAVRGRSTERTARDFARLPSMRSRGASCQNEAYPPSPFPTCIARSETRLALRL